MKEVGGVNQIDDIIPHIVSLPFGGQDQLQSPKSSSLIPMNQFMVPFLDISKSIVYLGIVDLSPKQVGWTVEPSTRVVSHA